MGGPARRLGALAGADMGALGTRLLQEPGPVSPPHTDGLTCSALREAPRRGRGGPRQVAFGSRRPNFYLIFRLLASIQWQLLTWSVTTQGT